MEIERTNGWPFNLAPLAINWFVLSFHAGFVLSFPWWASLFYQHFLFSFQKKITVGRKGELTRPQLQATNHFFQPKFISFSFLKRNVGWKEGLWASWGKMVMDVWPKVRERPSDSTFILESHACLSPPLAEATSMRTILPELAGSWGSFILAFLFQFPIGRSFSFLPLFFSFPFVGKEW